MKDEEEWPALPRSAWADTCDTLHMYAQIIGKVRLALTPIERAWANVPLSLTARGFTTGVMPYGRFTFQVDVDCISHAVEISVSDGQVRSIALIPALCVADFYERFMRALHEVGIDVRIWTMPVEVSQPIRCTDDRVHASYDPQFVHRFWSITARIASVFAEYRAPFRGRHTPVQFFWGTFDLAYVRFSGRPAQPPPDADMIRRVAMDAQEIAAGFWPGDDRFPEPALFCYAYPRPAGIEHAAIRPAAALWHEAMGEFVLRYDDVRTAPSPRAAILEFLTSTYDAGANLGGWERASLETASPTGA